MKLPSNNLNYPMRIVVGDSSGSGFLIKHDNDIFFVTAKHVLYRIDPATANHVLISEEAQIICYPRLGDVFAVTPRIYRLQISTLSQSGDLKVHQAKDLVVIKVGSVTENEGGFALDLVQGISELQQSMGGLIWYDMVSSRRFADVEITNDVFVLGYPISLSTPEMRQIDYDAPLARKGIVAGKNNQTQTIILDCPVYGGNSGGLVLEVNQVGPVNHLHLIGVVVQFVPFVEQWRNTRFPELQNTSLQNSGYSVALPVDNIYDLINQIEAND